MTRAASHPSDNGGRCEGCDGPSTIHEGQIACEVVLGGGLGMGTMWLCKACVRGRTPVVWDEELIELVEYHQRRLYDAMMSPPSVED